MFSYRNLLRQAWNLSWRYKHLWIFGLFASLTAAGGSMEYQVLTQNLNQSLINGTYVHINGLMTMGQALSSVCLGLAGLFRQDILVVLNVISLLLISLTLAAAIIWLAIASQAGLIDRIKKLLDSKKKLPDLSLREGLAAGNRHFWPVLGMNILIKILVNFAFFLISLPLLFMVLSQAPVLIGAYTVLFVIFVPVAVSLSLLVKYAIAYQVLDGERFVPALEKGWGLFRRHWLVSLEMAIILFIISFLAGLAMLVVVSIFIFPLFWMGAAFQMTWLTVLSLLLALIIIVVIGSWLVTFQISTWTSLFLTLKEKGGLAKLERLFSRR